MAFMKLDVQQFSAYRVETNCGSEIVPTALIGELDVEDDGSIAESCANLSELEQYCEGTKIDSVEKVTGYFARLSAPGYMDCTEWDGPHETREAALLSVREMYDVDADGNSEGEGDEAQS
jgi:hypothetical protein